MTASKRIEFAIQDGVLLRSDFFRAENANAPTVVMLGGFSPGPSSRARAATHTGCREMTKAMTSAKLYRSAGCAHACRSRRRWH
jgi:hypothetical protein